MKHMVLVLGILCALSGCSSIIEGTSQEIMVNTNPSEASCSLERQGLSIARVDPTPGAATIKKTKYDMIIRCNKDGYEEATYFNHSGEAGATFGNIVLGGGIGWAIDSAAGADNKYDSPVNITLAHEEGTTPKKKGKHKSKKHKVDSSSDATASEARSTNIPKTDDESGHDTDKAQWPRGKR